MSSGLTSRHPHHSALHDFDRGVGQLLGADMRVIYGMAGPILLIVGLIIVLALQPAEWLVAVMMVVEVAALALILKGIAELMDGDDDIAND